MAEMKTVLSSGVMRARSWKVVKNCEFQASHSYRRVAVA